ncbi:MAG: type II toxin-antitoxin system HipA family toxin [Bacteroidetes bacterium]|nr:type II toxin-antitoxin system HipA family toxin [Bacteroidota bacterium]
MITTANVILWGKKIGVVAWNNQQGLGTFEFTKLYYEQAWDVAPLMMPQSQKRVFGFLDLKNNNTFKGLPGLLADVLPDKYGSALINAWLGATGRPANSMNPVELLCYIGNRGMGALEFEPAYTELNNKATKIEVDGLVTIAQRIIDKRNTFKTNLKNEIENGLLDLITVGTSAGGARAKAIIAYNEKTGEVRSGQTNAPPGFEHWLIKFDGVTDVDLGGSQGFGKVEMAYHLMAKACNITMSECRLLKEHGRAHFMTRRFDREADSKIHLQSLCAMAHFDFENIGVYSYEQVFEVMRRLRLPYLDAVQQYRRMVFNVFARNCDDHTKNIAFLMHEDGEWCLSPAYDLCHAYRPGSPWVSLQSLSINGKRENISLEDFIAVAKKMNIKKPKEIITQIQNVIKQWKNFAKEVGVEKKLRDSIEKTLTLE